MATAEDLGMVEEGFEPKGDETVQSGEWLDPENAEAARAEQDATGNVNPYVPQEAQDMELIPRVIGPPGYGSPDPLTNAGRLVPIEDHPLANLPDDVESDAAISDDYGEMTDLERDSLGLGDADMAGDEFNATESAVELAAAKGVDLAQVTGTGTDGRITKGDVQNYIDAQ